MLFRLMPKQSEFHMCSIYIFQRLSTIQIGVVVVVVELP